MRFVLSLSLLVLAAPAHAEPCSTADCAYSGPLEPVRGPLAFGDVPVLVLNVFGQKPSLESDSLCEARLERTGQMIANAMPPYAIIGLNEVHPDYVGITCDGKAVIDAIQKNGEYGSGKHRWGHPETDWTSYDGGLALLSTSEFEWSPYSNHVHKYDFDPWGRTPSGFIFAEIRLTADVAIDVYVTHLHSQGEWPRECDRDCRYRDLEELARGIHDRSENSGNPVLVMGDFNIAGPNPSPGACDGNCGYADIMDVLRNPRDLWLESSPTGPGSTNSVNLPASVGKRIDFMFVMSDPFFYDSKYEIFLSRNVREPISLVKWTMDDGTPVSDHFGISAILEIRERLDPPKQCPCPTTPAVPQACEPGVVIE